jgi:MFS family permease
MATVSASALIVDLTPAGLRTDVQGVADLFMQSLAAVGGALSGVVVGWSGYPTLALGAVIPAGLVLVAAWQTRAKTLQTPH